MERLVQQYFKSLKTQFIIMFIVGQVNNQEELKEITFIAKLFVVGQRARELANETKKNK